LAFSQGEWRAADRPTNERRHRRRAGITARVLSGASDTTVETRTLARRLARRLAGGGEEDE